MLYRTLGRTLLYGVDVKESVLMFLTCIFDHRSLYLPIQ